MTYKIGDRIRMTTLVWGEQITDRKGNPIHQSPYEEVYEGVVKFAGPEAAFKGAVEVVRCTGGNKALKLNNGFSFYPKDNGPEQIVEVLHDNKTGVELRYGVQSKSMSMAVSPGVEILKVTAQGEFQWHPEADQKINDGDFSSNPAMPHILRKLRQTPQPEPVELTHEDIRAGGGIVHRDGNVFFTNVAMLNKAIAAKGGV